MDIYIGACGQSHGPSQKDFKLGGPRCSGCCTILARGHRIGPQGRLAIIQCEVTVQGRIGFTDALARADLPCQKDFKLGCPRCCCTVPPGRGHCPGPASPGPLSRAGLTRAEALARAAVPVRKTSSCWQGPRPAIGALGHCKGQASPAPWLKVLNEGSDIRPTPGLG